MENNYLKRFTNATYLSRFSIFLITIKRYISFRKNQVANYYEIRLTKKLFTPFSVILKYTKTRWTTTWTQSYENDIDSIQFKSILEFSEFFTDWIFISKFIIVWKRVTEFLLDFLDRIYISLLISNLMYAIEWFFFLVCICIIHIKNVIATTR